MVGASEVVMFEGAQRARRWSWPSLRWAGSIVVVASLAGL